MAKYRVYLKDGKGIFDVEADGCDCPAWDSDWVDIYDEDKRTVATFEKATIYAIINKDKARRVDDNEPIAIRYEAPVPVVTPYVGGEITCLES